MWKLAGIVRVSSNCGKPSNLYPQPVPAVALIDTGADITCLDSSLPPQLHLPVSSPLLANIPGAGGLRIASQYDVSLRIVHPTGNTLLDLVISDLIVLDVSLNTQSYQVLIGRDVLALCRLVYHGPHSRFRLSY